LGGAKSETPPIAETGVLKKPISVYFLKANVF